MTNDYKQQLSTALAALSSEALFQQLRAGKPVFWQNPHIAPFSTALADVGLSQGDVNDAAARLLRFAPLIKKYFPETADVGGIIESPLYHTPNLAAKLGLDDGALYVKADSELPISGSIKARGGIYEVLQHAEQLAISQQLLTENDDYSRLDSPSFKTFFARYSVAVGSTGNLGLSIGIMAAKLGFRTSVHMSADAKQWKKDKLRSHGVNVVEYAGDYGKAVAQGRQQAEADPQCYFVDDENSRHLFLGYAVAGARLKSQFDAAGITINAENPLYVYLPCGVGGGPGGVAFGLKLAFGDAVHCLFAEPVQSPCMLLGIYTGLHDNISVNDIGLSNHTIADGLAVGRASGFVGRAMQRSLDALFTVEDARLYDFLRLAYDSEQLKLEPSACAGFAGLSHCKHIKNATHLVWATGGQMMPDAEFSGCLEKGKRI